MQAVARAGFFGSDESGKLCVLDGEHGQAEQVQGVACACWKEATGCAEAACCEQQQEASPEQHESSVGVSQDSPQA